MGVVQVAPNNNNYEMPKNLAIELYKQTKQRVRVILTGQSQQHWFGSDLSRFFA